MNNNECTHCELNFTDENVYRLTQATDVEKFVADKWPTAVHSGMGYWRIPRKARIFYSGAHSDGSTWVPVLRYESMR